MRVLFLSVFFALAMTGCGLFPTASTATPTATATRGVLVVVITNTPTVTTTPTATLTPTPASGAQQLSPTRTRTPQRVAAKPSATATDIPQTAKLSLNGTTLENAIPIQNNTTINVPGSGRVFAVTGRRGLKIESQIITAYSGDFNAVSIKMYAPESLQQLKAALAGLGSWPGNVGAMTYNNNRGEYNIYAGKTGSSEGFVTIFQSNSPQGASFTFSVKESVGACASSGVSGTYWEGFWWTTCDENWLRGNGVIP